eukprot:5682891-Prymnesium_polylepis.1
MATHTADRSRSRVHLVLGNHVSPCSVASSSTKTTSVCVCVTRLTWGRCRVSNLGAVLRRCVEFGI